MIRPGAWLVGIWDGVVREGIQVPNNQNAIKTELSAPSKRPLKRALYRAHDDPGVPGRGSSPEEEGDTIVNLEMQVEMEN